MSGQELRRCLKDIEPELRPIFWGRQIQGAPKSVILMAECKVVASKPSAMTLDLSEFSLPRKTLYGNINHCTQLGEDTFRSTAMKMARVGYLTHEMSKPDGIIESMLKFIDPDQSRLRDKILHRHISKGLEIIDESRRMVKEVQEKFTDWAQATQDLYDALTDKASTNKQQQRETQGKINQKTQEKERLEEDAEEEKIELAKLDQKALEVYEMMLNSLPTSMSKVARMCAAAAIAGLSPELAFGVLVLGSIHVGVFHTDYFSEAEVAEIIKKALKDLKDLQEETTRFLDFLTGIQKMIISADDKRNHVFMGDLTPEERRDLICDNTDPGSQKLQEDALFLKNRFLIATKATSLYNDVSEKFVTPGVQWEAGLQLLDLTDNALNTKIKEIEEWRVKNM
ncbi:hypothetical protein CSUB01_07506 [Colletotrichum sublineola]|uniref:Uncharacterized protein n=1 Tax=Colletotrichum sublineola TaxID=1173701 RepID=A0A066XGB2_COLSU|nr:hypothetical protein CSUB01_07506 [Colletotrichum sublineola]